MRTGLALISAAIPVAAMIGGLPFVNRLEPTVFGLPFLLFWILAWVLSTPVFLAFAYVMLRRARSDAKAGSR